MLPLETSNWNSVQFNLQTSNVNIPMARTGVGFLLVQFMCSEQSLVSCCVLVTEQ